jgi:lipopolysaccharide/colanic/teichoic acid biosynthesis glycosyltransferase
MTLPRLADATPQPDRSRKFGYLLLAFVALTLASFWLLQRYAVYVARLYDYDIKNPLLQFILLLLLFALTTAGSGALATRLALRSENQLRLAFGSSLALAAVLAVYQSRFGMGPDQRELIHRLLKGSNYLAVGLLGAFAGALALTQHRYGLIEVIAHPEPDLVDRVREGHRHVQLADTMWDRFRRMLEILLSLTAIAVALPISLFLALAVWLQDPGPLLVAKVVVGRGGGSFNQLKLRSMRKDAEVATGPVPAAPEDRRVTRLGHLLRRTHIDELPQLINIFLGQMSLVGPRPERTVFVARHLNQIKDYAKRHQVRPGLAGLAQVYGDYYSTPREKLHYDLLYIRRRSLGLDAKLFLEAVALAILGRDPRRRHRTRPRHRRQDERFRQAYTALRGQAPPEASEPEGKGSAG